MANTRSVSTFHHPSSNISLQSAAVPDGTVRLNLCSGIVADETTPKECEGSVACFIGGQQSGKPNKVLEGADTVGKVAYDDGLVSDTTGVQIDFQCNKNPQGRLATHAHDTDYTVR